jgi:hypothetical protein
MGMLYLDFRVTTNHVEFMRFAWQISKQLQLKSQQTACV